MGIDDRSHFFAISDDSLIADGMAGEGCVPCRSVAVCLADDIPARCPRPPASFSSSRKDDEWNKAHKGQLLRNPNRLVRGRRQSDRRWSGQV
jgi:hypothetical protein